MQIHQTFAAVCLIVQWLPSLFITLPLLLNAYTRAVFQHFHPQTVLIPIICPHLTGANIPLQQSNRSGCSWCHQLLVINPLDVGISTLPKHVLPRKLETEAHLAFQILCKQDSTMAQRQARYVSDMKIKPNRWLTVCTIANQLPFSPSPIILSALCPICCSYSKILRPTSFNIFTTEVKSRRWKGTSKNCWCHMYSWNRNDVSQVINQSGHVCHKNNLQSNLGLETGLSNAVSKLPLLLKKEGKSHSAWGNYSLLSHFSKLLMFLFKG